MVYKRLVFFFNNNKKVFTIQTNKKNKEKEKESEQ